MACYLSSGYPQPFEEIVSRHLNFTITFITNPENGCLYYELTENDEHIKYFRTTCEADEYMRNFISDRREKRFKKILDKDE